MQIVVSKTVFQLSRHPDELSNVVSTNFRDREYSLIIKGDLLVGSPESRRRIREGSFQLCAEVRKGEESNLV